MKIEVLDDAEADLIEGRDFYERKAPGIGAYFATAIASDIDSLILTAGILPVLFGFYRLLSKRFPFGIYYGITGDIIQIQAVLDLRREPAWIRERMRG